MLTQLSTRFATELVGQLAHADELKTAIRDAGGLLALVRHLKAEGQREEALETVTRALTVLVINNRTNQDYIRCVLGFKALRISRRPQVGRVCHKQSHQPGQHQVYHPVPFCPSHLCVGTQATHRSAERSAVGTMWSW